MTTTLCEAKRKGASIWLSVYHDFHRYEAIYTVSHTNALYYSSEGAYVEKQFKTFSAACKYFNKVCEKYSIQDCVIW